VYRLITYRGFESPSLRQDNCFRETFNNQKTASPWAAVFLFLKHQECEVSSNPGSSASTLANTLYGGIQLLTDRGEKFFPSLRFADLYTYSQDFWGHFGPLQALKLDPLNILSGSQVSRKAVAIHPWVIRNCGKRQLRKRPLVVQLVCLMK
jgi:hypothetical protein